MELRNQGHAVVKEPAIDPMKLGSINCHTYAVVESQVLLNWNDCVPYVKGLAIDVLARPQSERLKALASDRLEMVMRVHNHLARHQYCPNVCETHSGTCGTLKAVIVIPI